MYSVRKITKMCASCNKHLVRTINGQLCEGCFREHQKKLTFREKELISILAINPGITNKEVARLMCVGTGTVKVYMSHVFAKLGIENRTELSVKARERKLTEPILDLSGRSARGDYA